MNKENLKIQTPFEAFMLAFIFASIVGYFIIKYGF